MPVSVLSVRSRKSKQVIDITDSVEECVVGMKLKECLVNIFVAHTTACVTTGEAIEGTDEDLMEVLEKIIPRIRFRHAHDPSHAPDHMISSLVGAGISIPFSEGRLMLGTWQRVLFIECNGPRSRDVVVTAILA